MPSPVTPWTAAVAKLRRVLGDRRRVDAAADTVDRERRLGHITGQAVAMIAARGSAAAGGAALAGMGAATRTALAAEADAIAARRASDSVRATIRARLYADPWPDGPDMSDEVLERLSHGQLLRLADQLAQRRRLLSERRTAETREAWERLQGELAQPPDGKPTTVMASYDGTVRPGTVMGQISPRLYAELVGLDALPRIQSEPFPASASGPLARRVARRRELAELDDSRHVANSPRHYLPPAADGAERRTACCGRLLEELGLYDVVLTNADAPTTCGGQ